MNLGTASTLTCNFRRRTLAELREVVSRLPSKNLIRRRAERYIDKYHQRFRILCRDRDLAAIHLLRCFEDMIRFRLVGSLGDADAGSFHRAMRWAQEALPWALRWVWAQCPTKGSRDLSVNWDVYEEAGLLLRHAFDYYHLSRCFVLYSRGHFTASYDRACRAVHFSFASAATQRIDAVRQVHESERDANKRMSPALREFIRHNAPVVQAVFPHYLDKIDELNIRYEATPDITRIFQRWADLYCQQLRFDLPADWRFGAYSLQDFRLFWTTLICTCQIHWHAHVLADAAVGSHGGAVGSVVMHIKKGQLENLADITLIPRPACQEIITDLTYGPLEPYWDPIWQPLIPLKDGSYLISTALVLTSSPERNLVILLNRLPGKRELYATVSTEKENQQLNELERLFSGGRYLSRRRVVVRNSSGEAIGDIDLLVFDPEEATALLIYAKWLVRPDYIREVLSKDEELEGAIRVARNCAKRALELGAPWVCGFFGRPPGHRPLVMRSIVVNRDFLPCGWVKRDEDIPIVDEVFVGDFIRSGRFTGLLALHDAALDFDRALGAEHPVRFGTRGMQVGSFSFNLPTIE